jgi:hypothetical protein
MTENLRETVVHFLNSTATESAMVHTNKVFCRGCGSAVEYRMSTFIYVEQTWEILLPICLKCYPVVQVLTHDA